MKKYVLMCCLIVPAMGGMQRLPCGMEKNSEEVEVKRLEYVLRMVKQQIEKEQQEIERLQVQRKQLLAALFQKPDDSQKK